jgi:5,10-methylenetetrahydrofolate reductase
MIETFFELEELTAAIEAVQRVSRLPIVAMLTFDEDAETFGGVSARAAFERLAGYELAAVGANHGAGLHAALAALEAMGNGRPLAALPNVGLASLSGGRVIYPHATPEYFAEFAAQARALGARVIGGCCGTTPTEIAAIARAVEEERQPTAPFAAAERELVVASHERPDETELARQLRAGEWVTCVELDPPKGGTYDAMLAVTKTLKDSGEVGFVDINDNPMARARVDSIGLARVVTRLNAGEDFNGKAIDAPTSFFLGVAVNPSADDLETELDRFRQKLEAGAQFAMTQALFDLSYLDRFEELLGGWPIPVLVGIFMVRSHQLAVRLHNEVPGIVVPEHVQNRLRDAGPNAAEEGLALARELNAGAREKAAGVYVIPPFKQPEAALELLGSGVAPPSF